jgi:hypothetical protein
VSAVGKLSLRRDPIRLLLSRGPWAAAWYLLGYLVVGWALFAIALRTAVAGDEHADQVVGWFLSLPRD